MRKQECLDRGFLIDRIEGCTGVNGVWVDWETIDLCKMAFQLMKHKGLSNDMLIVMKRYHKNK